MIANAPPSDLDAEAAVLATILVDSVAFDLVAADLKADHFYSEAHRIIYEAFVGLASNGKPIDTVTVASWLRDRDRLTQIGGAAYLARIANELPFVPNVETYAAVIREKSRLRQMIIVGRRIAAEGNGDVGDPQEWIDRCEQSVYDIAHTTTSSTVEPIRPILLEAFQEISDAASRGERITGVPTGFERLDGKMAGLHEGDLTIIAARPGVGKTSFGLDVAKNVAASFAPRLSDGGMPPSSDKSIHGVIFFSLEMPKKQLVVRMHCSEARVDLGKIRQGFLQARDWSLLTDAAPFVSNLPIWIDDSSNSSVLEIRAKTRRTQSLYNQEASDTTPARRIGLVIIDYLQLMKGDQKGNREQEVSSIARGLKGLAKELKVPVIALCQLNRAVETRGKDKRPQLSDLRESGAIEQDADNIIFIYRDDYYFKEESQEKGIAELIIAKQRSGPTGTVKVRYTDWCTRFDNLSPGEINDEDSAA